MLQYKNTELNLFLDGIHDGARVLDYGCNDGWVSREVNRCKPRCEVSGADINPAALKTARRRGGGVEYFDARNGELNGKTFDVVILSHVLEHVHARLELLQLVVDLIARGLARVREFSWTRTAALTLDAYVRVARAPGWVS